MAVLDDLNGVKVEILVNDLSANEYADEDPGVVKDEYDEAVPRSYHYIQSADDTKFSIKVTAAPHVAGNWLMSPPSGGSKKGLFFYCDVDGQHGIAFGHIQAHQLSCIVAGVEEWKGRQRQTRGFRFAAVSTVDNAGKQQVAEDTIKARSLGTIRVRVYRSTYRNVHAEGVAARFPALGLESKITIAEKALKGRALSHGSTLSPDVVTTEHNLQSEHHLDGAGEQAPLAVYHFKYRSKEALRQEMILPRSRGVSVESDVDKLPQEEIRRLAREHLAQARGKRKRAASVKAEPGLVPRSERPLKVSKTKGGKVTIDLTGDD